MCTRSYILFSVIGFYKPVENIYIIIIIIKYGFETVFLFAS